MPLSRAEQDRIMQSDALRRAEREILENARLGIDVTSTMSDAYKIAHAPKDSHVNACLVRNIGVICPPAKTSASRNCWDRGMKGTTKGVAPGSTDPTPSMAVYKDGKRTIVPISATRARSEKTSTVNATTRTPETARIKLQHDFNN